MLQLKHNKQTNKQTNKREAKLTQFANNWSEKNAANPKIYK